MKVEQLYTKCLSEASYFIVSDGEAAVIDPIRETEPYLEMAHEHNVKIKYIFETHFHADFVSGHIDLAKKTGATIVYGPTATAGYQIYVGKDGENFPLGSVNIKLLHTPGHTLESSCFLLQDETGRDRGIFTGDTVFVGDVGRPDLAVKSDLSREDLAALLYDSLEHKIKPLADDVILYPGHGAGSACGKNIGKETISTLGEQRKTNYALQPMDKDEFVRQVTDGLLTPPSYFFEDARINKTGYDPIDEVLERNMHGMSIAEFEQEIANGALILDSRDADEFEKGFIKGSLNIGLEGQFAVWAGTLIKINQPIIVVASDVEKAQETVLRLARVGYENVHGFLAGGFSTWANAGKPTERVQSITAKEAAALISELKVAPLDVREPSEFAPAHIAGAVNIRLQELPVRTYELNKDCDVLTYCGGGYRSMIAISILRRNGYVNVINVKGGFKALQEADAPTIYSKEVLAH